MRFRSLAAAVPLLAAVVITGTPASSPAPAAKPVAAAKPAAAANGWTTYHFDNARDGNDTFESAYTAHDTAADWTRNDLDGLVFASPLVSNGMVFVATENNTVYALREADGTNAWATPVQVATPPPDDSTHISCDLQFGATDGITGTPVIDPVGGVIYVVALVDTASFGHLTEYQLFGLRTSDGTQVLHTSLGSPGLDPKFQIQRGALGLSGGKVYVTFGGRPGDCNPYHPWVVSAPTSGGAATFLQPQTGSQQDRAGIWSPSGMAIDAAGNVYASTGNGGGCNVGDHSESVLKISPALSLTDQWQTSNWCTYNTNDTDVGSVAPMLLSNGDLFQSGKTGEGWLLNSANLGGTGGEEFAAGISGCSAVFGGYAYDGTRAYVPCEGHGIVALNVNTSTHNFTTAWESATTGGYSGNAGSPILAGGVLWTQDQGTNSSGSTANTSLHGFDPATGAARFDLSVGSARRFTTLAADNGYLLAMLDHGVRAFHMTTFAVNYTAYFPWYDHISSPNFRDDNIHIINPGPNPVFVSVTIPGCPPTLGDTIVGHGENIYNCARGFGGPVRIEASARVIASQRVRYGATFNEVPALSASANKLVFPWYDDASPGFLADNIHVVNPGPNAATVTVTIPRCSVPPQTIAAGSYGIFNCAQGYGGPVTLISTGNPVMASQRVQYFSSFNESPALDPITAAGPTMWVSWYDRISDANFLSDNLHVVNTDPAVTASVHVTIPGCASVPDQSIPPNQGAYFNCASGGNGGPVKIVSNTKVLVASRVQYGQTFNEVAGQPTSAASTPLYFPWFDIISDVGFTSDNVHVVNPNAGSVTVTVSIPPCGTLPPMTLGGGQATYFTCGRGFSGPVTVTSTGGNVLASQRVKYYQSFNEVAAQP